MLSRFQNAFSICVLSLAFFNATNAALTPSGCEIDDNFSEAGAVVRFYEYPFYDIVDNKDINFLSGGYLSNNLLTIASQVTDITWSAGLLGNTLPYGVNGIPPDHFVMEITGYYRTSQTGFHNINLDALGSTALFMGSGSAYDCCGQLNDFTASNPILTNGLNAIDLPKEVYMESGLYYPFKMVYIKYGIPGSLSLKITFPDGAVDATVGNNLHVYSVGDTSHCRVVSKSLEATTYLKTSSTAATYTDSLIVSEPTVATPFSSGASTMDTSITTATIGTESNTVSDTSTATSLNIGSVTKGTTITTGSTSSVNNIVSENSASTSLNSASIHKGETTTSVTTITDSSTIPEASTAISSKPSSSNDRSTSDTVTTGTVGNSTETVTSTSLKSFSTNNETTCISTSGGSVTTTIPQTRSALDTLSSGAASNKVWPSSSISTGIHYDNCTSLPPASHVSSQNVASASEVISSVITSPDTTLTGPSYKLTASSSKCLSPDISRTTPVKVPTPPASHDDSGLDSGNGGTSNNNNNGSKDSSNNDKDDNDTASGNVGSSNNNNEHDGKGRDEGSMATTAPTMKPYSSPSVAITPSLSAYEGLGSLNSKWSFTSLLAIAFLVFA